MIYAAKNQVIGAYFGNKKVLKMYLGDVQVYASKVPVIVTIDGVETTTTMGSGEPLSITLSPSVGRQIMPWTVVVTMDDVDITATAYDKTTNTVSIASLEAVVEITAESVEMSADYAPVEYISVASRQAGNTLWIDYWPNEKTKLVMDVELTSGNNSLLFSNKGGISADAPNFQLCYQGSNSSRYNVGWGNTYSANLTADAGRIKKNARITATFDNGRFTYPNASGGTFDQDYNNGETWQSDPNASPTRKLRFFGYNTSSATGTAAGKIWRITIYEGNSLMADCVPCKRLSDGRAGLYDTVNEVYISATNYTYPS
ncbi:MAG: hypothetical protein IKH15_06840 [Bacteroidales bacterium]|nr:hypothetical protein [Bacteroidales bacterium]